ncbi:MAG: transglutaminase domain-containing protein [Candidatus Latescibacteria bacterium]|nr:transglutaminase domain-containing protein [Candidatus Latescibacterota bacterium]
MIDASRWLRAGALAGLFGFATPALADEGGVSIDQIALAIEAHIDEKTAADGGYYRLAHDGRELRLKLVRIHMEYLADLGGGVQFACVDLVGTDGPVYDVDFFLRGDAEHMTVTETTVHKVNGQPLYVWEQKQDETWVRVAVTDATPRLLGVIQGEDEFEFTYRVRLPELSGTGVLWLPLAGSDGFQTVQVQEILAPSEPRRVEEREHGNQVLVLEVGPRESGATIEIRYRVHRVEQSPYPVAGSSRKDGLAPERLVPSDDVFRDIAAEVTRGKSTDLMRARALYDHVIDEVRYARYGAGWGRGDAVYACNAKSGNCTDFHSYFIALARSVGIPARFAIGAAIPSERNEGGIDGYHCWAEFFADDRWWPVDISEADKNSSLASYYFGHRPANRIELSRGRDLVVEPGPASGPINFLAYAVLEVDGETIHAPTEFQFRRFERASAD